MELHFRWVRWFVIWLNDGWGVLFLFSLLPGTLSPHHSRFDAQTSSINTIRELDRIAELKSTSDPPRQIVMLTWFPGDSWTCNLWEELVQPCVQEPWTQIGWVLVLAPSILKTAFIWANVTTILAGRYCSYLSKVTKLGAQIQDRWLEARALLLPKDRVSWGHSSVVEFLTSMHKPLEEFCWKCGSSDRAPAQPI
jgi:hypothetical protein